VVLPVPLAVCVTALTLEPFGVLIAVVATDVNRAPRTPLTPGPVSRTREGASDER
jgi:hypothetical protein